MGETQNEDPSRIPIKSKAGMVEVRVKHVALDEKDQKANVVFLTDKDERFYMPLWIGEYEANEIKKVMNSELSERPGVYQLFKNTLESLKAKVDKVVISEMRGTTFIAQLFVKGSSEIIIDSRPSDAICLAYWFEATIFIKDEVLNEAAYLDWSKNTDEERAQGFVLVD